MTESSVAGPLPQGKESKFTPTNIQQIINLVERGKSREEIAEIIGVTPGTLAVTCSRLKISLRGPRFDLGTGVLRRRRSQAPDGANSHQMNGLQKWGVLKTMEEQPASNGEPIKATAAPDAAILGKTSISASPKLAVRILYKGNGQTIESPVSLEMVGRLFLEAEHRSMRIGELFVRLILGIAEKNLFQLVLDSPLPKPIARAQDHSCAVAEEKPSLPSPPSMPIAS
jgi:DNA-binding CsgD family transcriptional regulator